MIPSLDMSGAMAPKKPYKKPATRTTRPRMRNVSLKKGEFKTLAAARRAPAARPPRAPCAPAARPLRAGTVARHPTHYHVDPPKRGY